MTRASDPGLLVLHAVRLKGMADVSTVAARFGLDQAMADELLLDYQAYGWVTWSEFAGTGGWSLTPAGRAENERRLAVERKDAGDAVLREVYQEFLPLNARLQQACTDWQLRPSEDDPMAFNDHTDAAWDARVVKTLTALSVRLDELVTRLSGVLERLGGYDERFATALGRVPRDNTWVDGSGKDSCHTVWFELHEDLIATLAVERGQ
ncbi:transcriptional regulator [Kribbella sp. ALI-6-A]|uniref:transcriptional regulator n=1 Tax=Kribbella sp. ALI-6-A TaxID=1933817 RepID=UPI00097C8539|nr:transcriptional regulator [Kribbella sp. ALI-6-A]ONI69671.1 transcriptional regulator [Kribbella sp. ALI-6-A]